MQLAFGAACGGAYIVMRSVVELVSPGAGPFALMFPLILVATLFGHWKAGLIAFVMTFMWAWYAILPYRMSLELANPEDGMRIFLNGASGLILMFLAEAFRRAVRSREEQLDAEVLRNHMLMRELEHRTKNNFALLSSLMQLQRRAEPDGAAREALSVAARRLHSFASIYDNLPIAPSIDETTPMRPYLTNLVQAVAKAVFGDRVAVALDIADLALPRQTALAIALYANEALTNCAKHAFGAGEAGIVEVTFAPDGDGWVLCVTDDGRGRSGTRSGTGSSLMDAFARQANAVHRHTFSDAGCSAELRSRA